MLMKRIMKHHHHTTSETAIEIWCNKAIMVLLAINKISEGPHEGDSF